MPPTTVGATIKAMKNLCLTARVCDLYIATMSSQTYSPAVKLLGAVLAVVLFVSGLEVIVRAVGVETTFRNRFFVLNRALDYPDVFEKDRDLFWRFRPDRTITSEFFQGKTYNINSRGLRGPELTAPNVKPRLLAIGNSCTFGWGVAEDSIYVRVLERLLDGRYEIVNGAIPGYSSLQGKRFLARDLLPLEPSVLLVLFAWNDHWAAANNIADKDQQFAPQWILNIQNLLSRLESYRLYKKLLLSAIEPSPDSLFTPFNVTYRVDPDDFYTNLHDICALGRSHNIRVVFLTSPIPSLETYYAPGMRSPMHAFHARYNDVIRKIVGDTGAELVDIAAVFDQYSDLFDDAAMDPIHFNAKGHAIAAQAIADVLRAEGRI